MLLVATGGEVCRGGTQQGRPRNRAGFRCSLCRWECAPALAVGRDDVSAVVSLCWCQLNGLAWILEVSISLVLVMSCVPRDAPTSAPSTASARRSTTAISRSSTGSALFFTAMYHKQQAIHFQ